jgi:hypothetical protein
MQEHPMPTNRKFGFLRLWRWTVELFSSGLILALWNTPKSFTTPDLGYWFWFGDLRDTSFPVIVLLFATAIFSSKRHRGHSAFGLILCALWLVWIALPRL